MDYNDERKPHKILQNLENNFQLFVLKLSKVRLSFQVKVIQCCEILLIRVCVAWTYSNGNI
jgi:hypothetical protein